MEAWGAIFRNLYTGFLLRDFAGKIVPGVFLLFSLAAMFRHPARLIVYIKKEMPVHALMLVAGFAWVMTLGIQSVSEGVGIWNYFIEQPSSHAQAPESHEVGFIRNLLTGGNDEEFDRDTLRVDDFQANATEDEKQQYERFVVIKEACGNLFVVMLLSLPAWLYVCMSNKPKIVQWLNKPKIVRWAEPIASRIPSPRLLLVGAYGVLLLTGLHRMHVQHATRQYFFADKIAAKHASEQAKKPIDLHLDLEEKQH
jgi:hypothetical protein